MLNGCAICRTALDDRRWYAFRNGAVYCFECKAITFGEEPLSCPCRCNNQRSESPKT